MVANTERIPVLKEPKSFRALMREVPDAIGFATLEAEQAGLAASAEGKFILTYLLASRNLLKPVLTDAHIHNDLMTQTGGSTHNPSRNIDAVGSAIAMAMAKNDTTIPNLWFHTEESSDWAPARPDSGFFEEAQRFAVVDPMDMTSAIARGDRVQSTGMAIYDNNGELLALGMMSLVDDKFIFIDHDGKGETVIHSNTGKRREDVHDVPEHIRFAAKTRRMYILKELPINQNGNFWSLDCDSGYAVLSLHNGLVDTIIDHVKGNPWDEVVIWIKAAQELGYTVTDVDGNPVDISKVMRHVIRQHEGDSYRVPFIVSKNNEIHTHVLNLLQKQPETSV